MVTDSSDYINGDRKCHALNGVEVGDDSVTFGRRFGIVTAMWRIHDYKKLRTNVN